MKFRFPSALPLLALVSALGTVSHAAPPSARPSAGGRPVGRPANGGEIFLDYMTKALNLSPSQRTKFAAEIRASEMKGQAIFRNKSLTPAQKQAQIAASNNASQKRVDAMLSPTQRAKLAAFIKNSQRQAPRQIKMRPEDDLHITPAQKVKIDALQKKYGPRFRAIFQNKSLSEGQKRAKMQALSGVAEKEMNAVLTPEQLRKRAAIIKRLKAQSANMGGGRPMR